jgi:subtilisin family serine protease
VRFRTVFAGAIAALAVLLLAPAGAGAITCSNPESAYSKDAGTIPAYGGPASTGDPLAKSQWGLAQVKAPAAWARGARGAGATIAVVDTGIDLTHPDLAGKILPGTDFVPPSGEFPDQCPGPQDENGHGTHVAGIAAAVTGNGIGVAGVAPDAKVIPVRVLASDGAEPEVGTAYQGIRWAAEAGADVINLSLGGLPLLDYADGSDEQAEQAVDFAWSKGAVVVASAGNESFPICSYPSAAKHAVCVAATDAGEAPTYYSNFPATPDQNVALRAPGGLGSVFCEDSEDIWSTVWPGGETTCGDLHGYETFSGTSMAAPHVAGVAALLAGRGLTNAQIVECLRTTSSNGGEYDPAFGYGIVDADAATSKCAAATTPAFEPPPQPGPSPSPNPSPNPEPAPPSDPPSGGGEAQVTVTVKRTSRQRLARSGRLTAVVRTDRAVSVKLRAVLTRAKTRTAGKATVRMRGAGRRTVVVKLSRSARRALARSSKYRIVVRWRAGSRTGSATATR